MGKHWSKPKKHQKNPPPEVPESAHPVWPVFIVFVETMGVVRADLVHGDRLHWELVWNTFLAGYEAGVQSSQQK